MFYLADRRHTYTVAAWLDSPGGRELATHMHILSYQDLLDRRRLRPGTYIFTDHERWTSYQRQLAINVWEQLSRAGDRVRLFNDPSKVLTRYPLLTALHASGQNSFRAFRATEPLNAVRFPVFVRDEHEHTGNLSDLLGDHEALRSELQRLTSIRKGYRIRDLLVVEFCDTSDESGRYNKYSAYKIGDQVFGRYYSRGPEWMLKAHSTEWDEEVVRRERDYIEDNPHAEQLRGFFELAHIDYGRIDYGMVGDCIQVWEINTNPTIGPGTAARGQNPSRTSEEIRMLREPAKEWSHARIRRALKTIDIEGDTGPAIDLDIDRSLRRRIRIGLATDYCGDIGRRIHRRVKRLRQVLPWQRSAS